MNIVKLFENIKSNQYFSISIFSSSVMKTQEIIKWNMTIAHWPIFAEAIFIATFTFEKQRSESTLRIRMSWNTVACKVLDDLYVMNETYMYTALGTAGGPRRFQCDFIFCVFTLALSSYWAWWRRFFPDFFAHYLSSRIVCTVSKTWFQKSAIMPISMETLILEVVQLNTFESVNAKIRNKEEIPPELCWNCV